MRSRHPRPEGSPLRRIALFSDIHGNLPALEAVLTDLDPHGVEERYCLGDLVGYGPLPAEVVARVRDLGIPTVQGNYDEGIGNRRGECGCYYSTEQAAADGAASYVFTDSAIGDEDAAWLASLPQALRLQHDGCRVLLVHGSPRKVNEYLLPDRTDAQLARLADEAGADIVCVGHVHVPYHRALRATGATRPELAPVHYVSAGSVGKPKDGDPRACWVELLLGPEAEIRSAAAAGDPAAGPAGSGGVWIATREHRVAYDVAAVQRAMLEAGLPPRLAEALATA